MAQLKDTIVSGNLRVTDTTLTDTLQVTIIKAPTSSGGTTYGPGTSGQVLKSNGTSVYWTSDSTVSPATTAPQDVSTTAVIGTSTLYARQDHVHAIALATGDKNGQVKIANSNVSVKGLASAAYVTQESLLRARSTVSTDGGATGWSQIGINQYNNAYPDGVTNKIYSWGAVVSIPAPNARFDLYYNHNSSTAGATTNGLQYRTGWDNDKKAWRMLLDSGNYTSYTVTKTGGGASGSWGISITGNAANVTGTVAIANGGTGATTRLNALKNLTNENVGSSANYFLTITSSWGKGGYTSVADAKTVLGLKSAAYTESSAYLSSTTNYAGSSSIGGAATSANKLNTDAGGTYLPVYFNNGVPEAVTVKNNTSKGTIGWTSGAAANAALVTVNSIAYWNGAYSGTSSNLAYCNKGEFGTIVTKNAEDYALSTHTHGLLHSNLTQAASNVTTGGWSVIGIDPAVNGYVLKSIRINEHSPNWLSGNYGAGIAFGGYDTKGVISMNYHLPTITFAGGNHKSTITSPTWYFKISGTSGNTYNLANFYDSTISRTANTVLAAPNGSNGSASFRKLVAADLPSHTHSYLPLSGTTINNPNTSSVSFTNGMTGNILFTNTGDTDGVARGIGGIVGTTDSWSVRGYQTGNNKGCLEIAVGDDGDEGIYARQYTSRQYKATFSNNAGTASGLTYRELVLMAPSTGASTFPSDVTLSGGKLYLSGGAGSYGQLNLKTGSYNVMFRNDNTNTYILLTAKDDPNGTWTSARPLTINNSTGVCSINGNAASATILKTARNINGVSFDGSADITIPRSIKHIHTANGTDGSGGWVKIARITVTEAYADQPMTFTIAQRRIMQYRIHLLFTNSGSAAATEISEFIITRDNSWTDTNNDPRAYIIKPSDGIFDLYIRKTVTWDRIFVVDFTKADDGGGISYSVTWTNVHVADSAITGGTEAVKKLYLPTTTNYAGSSSPGGPANSATYATRANYINVVAGNEIRFYNDNQLKANNHFWLGYSWADGSHYTPSGGSDTSSTTAPNITKFIMGNCSQGGLASVHAKTFILGNGSSPTHTSKTTTIATAATTTNRTITLPNASGNVILGTKGSTSFWGLMDGDGSTSGWIRGTSSGFLPSQGAKFFQTATSSLGTSNWYFENSYIQYMNANSLVLGAAKTADGAAKGQVKFFSGNANDTTGTVTLECVNDSARTGDYTVKLPTWNGTIPVFEKLFEGASNNVSLSFSDINEYDLFLITVANSNAKTEQVTVASLWISNIAGVHDMPLIWGGAPTSSGGECNVTSGWIQLKKNSGTTTFVVAHKPNVAQMTSSGWSISSPTYNLYIRKIFGLKTYKRT